SHPTSASAPDGVHGTGSRPRRPLSNLTSAAPRMSARLAIGSEESIGLTLQEGTMTKTIVCGVDGTETAAAAARTAAELALALDAQLHLVSAYGKLKAETIEVGSDRMLLSNEQEAETTAREVELGLRRDFPELKVSSGAAEG